MKNDAISHSCEAIGPLLSEHAAGTLAASDAERVRAHLEGCARCRAEAEALDEIERLLRDGPALAPGCDFTAQVLAALPPRPQRAEGVLRRLRPARLVGAALAAAAAVVLAMLLPEDPGLTELQGQIEARAVVPEHWIGLLNEIDAEGLDAVVQALDTELRSEEQQVFGGALSATDAWATVAEMATADPATILGATDVNEEGGAR